MAPDTHCGFWYLVSLIFNTSNGFPEILTIAPVLLIEWYPGKVSKSDLKGSWDQNSTPVFFAYFCKFYGERKFYKVLQRFDRF